MHILSFIRSGTMKLVKMKSGLLEYDNFYLTSDFGDFLGTDGSNRDGETLEITTTERIERRFDYQSFLVQIEKEDWTDMLEEDRSIFYVSDGVDEYGLVEVYEEDQNAFQKLIMSEGFLQCYSSKDGKEWENEGGIDFKGRTVSKQGFRKSGLKTYKLKDYAVYSEAHVTVQNFPEGYKAVLKDSNGSVIRERLFGGDMQSKVFLDNNMRGSIEVYDADNTLVLSTGVTELNFGDVFIMSDYELELLYRGQPVEQEDTTQIAMNEIVTIKNVSTSETYSNLTVLAEIDSNDIVEFSLDGINYGTSATIATLAPGEAVDLYISISRGEGNEGTFTYKDFLLKIEG
jgi:hypothetical protein